MGSFVEKNMHRIFISAVCMLAIMTSKAQTIELEDAFPDFVIRNLVNAPAREVDVYKQTDRFIILNFWGTWCAPCLPEMDSLREIQKRFGKDLRVIALANDNEKRVKNYLAKRPTGVWIAADTSFHLYKQFGFTYVGQSAILDRQRRVIGLVRTDSINTAFIRKMLRGEKLPQSGERSKGVAGNSDETDFFRLDSTLQTHLTLMSYVPGQRAMSRYYPQEPFKNRRRTFFNVSPTAMYKTAYDITSQKQVAYEFDEKAELDYSNRGNLYCFDILVAPGQEDSLNILMQQRLNMLLPVKARMEKKMMPVYVLRTTDATGWKNSTAAESSWGFSGRGFEGTAIPLQHFADYLANELPLPVVDETGLSGKYDIRTENVLRTVEEVKAAVQKLGLSLEKAEREIDLLILYKP